MSKSVEPSAPGICPSCGAMGIRCALHKAAPELLKELKGILDWALVEKAALREVEIDSIRNVIAKAEGK